jgi:hypothetical protein
MSAFLWGFEVPPAVSARVALDNEGVPMTATDPIDPMLSAWGETHDRLLKEVEAAEFLRLAPATLRQWRYRGHGPAYQKLRSRVTYRFSELVRFVAGNN